MFENIFTTVLNMSFTASIVTIFIVLFRLIFNNKLPKILTYALWGIILVRLLIPFSIPSMFSLFNIIPVPETVTTQNAQYQEIKNTITFHNPKGSISNNKIIIEDNIKYSDYISDNPKSSVNAKNDITFIISLIWLLGVTGLFLFSIFAYYRTRFRLKTAILYNNNLVSKCSSKIKLKRKIQLFTSDRIDTPVVCGLFKPRIVLPLTVVNDYCESELEYIITHELVHIKRFDYIIKLISVITLCIHWFNPIIWVSFILSQRDMEMACDEKVLLLCDDDKRSEYAISLIKFAVKQNVLLNGGLLAFGESSIKSRIKGIMKFKKPGFWISVTSIIILITIGIMFITNGLNNDIDIQQSNEGIKGNDNNVEQSNDIKSSDTFEIYIVKDNENLNSDLNKLQLEDKPVITGDNLIAYYWDCHILKLKKGDYIERIKKFTPVSGKPFVLVSNGKRLYKGYFWTSLSSLSYPSTPLILVDGINNEEDLYIQRDRDEVFLQLTLPPNMKDQEDLLNQAELYNALKESKKLESSNPPENSDKIYNIDMSKTEKVTIEHNGKVIYTIKESDELKNFSSYLYNMTLLPNDNKIRHNRSSLFQFKLWNNDGTSEKYNTVYDSLYDIGYINMNGVKVRTSIDFFRLLESYSRYPGLRYDVPADVKKLFNKYGWTISFKVNEIKEKLPFNLEYQVGEFPIKIYWAYNFILSKEIGFSNLETYLGNIVNIEIYRMNEGLPEKFEPNVEARGIVIRKNGKIIGAYMDRGGHSCFACSLNRKTLKQITEKTLSKWVTNYIDFDNKLLKELNTLSPEDIIKTSFNALNEGDYKRYYATFTIEHLVSYLSRNMGFSGLYNKDYPDTNIKKAKLLNIGDSIDEDGYKIYPVKVNYDFKKMITHNDGPQPRFVGMRKESEKIGWRITGIGTAP